MCPWTRLGYQPILACNEVHTRKVPIVLTKTFFPEMFSNVNVSLAAFSFTGTAVEMVEPILNSKARMTLKATVGQTMHLSECFHASRGSSICNSPYRLSLRQHWVKKLRHDVQLGWSSRHKKPFLTRAMDSGLVSSLERGWELYVELSCVCLLAMKIPLYSHQVCADDVIQFKKWPQPWHSVPQCSDIEQCGTHSAEDARPEDGSVRVGNWERGTGNVLRVKHFPLKARNLTI